MARDVKTVYQDGQGGGTPLNPNVNVECAAPLTLTENQTNFKYFPKAINACDEQTLSNPFRRFFNYHSSVLSYFVDSVGLKFKAAGDCSDYDILKLAVMKQIELYQPPLGFVAND